MIGFPGLGGRFTSVVWVRSRSGDLALQMDYPRVFVVRDRQIPNGTKKRQHTVARGPVPRNP